MWVAFLDADDEWHPDKIKIQLAYQDVMPNIVFITNVPLIVRPGETKIFPAIANHDIPFTVWRHLDFLRRNTVHTSSVLLKRDVYAAVGGCDTRLVNAEDRDLWLKALYCGNGICVNFPLTKYNYLSGSLSKNIIRRFNCDLTVLNKWDNRCSDTLDIKTKVPINTFIRTKYAVLYSMIFKLLCLGMNENARDFYYQLYQFHKQEYPSYVPQIPWAFFKFIAFLELRRKQIKYGNQN